MTTLSVPSENRALNFIIKTEDLSAGSPGDHGGLSEKHSAKLMISTARIPTERGELECWICKAVFNSANEFTFHLRSHNTGADGSSDNKSRFECKVCHKVLGSANSLDRHILIHTGERPFKCKYCNLTFTTNGNMHRHVRVNHQAKVLNSSTDDCWSHDSNGSADSYDDYSSSPSTIEKKRKFSDSEYNNNNSSNIIDNNNINDNCKDIISRHVLCPVCNSEESSLQDLEHHLTDAHPEYQARCQKCNLLFQNYQFLNLHVYMVHHKENVYNGLTNGKINIPNLAGLIKESQILSNRNATNRSNSVANERKCEKCFMAFPNSTDLAIHMKSCVTSDADTSSNENYSATNLCSIKSKRNCSESSVEEEKKRDEFFNGLDLKNVGKNLSNGVESKDLADIQSIITNTSTSHLITDLSKSPEPNATDVSQMDSSCGDEEQQDCFAAEFRKMKLRGEFPCRLCSSIFPNLRALKGHNRVHLNSCPGSLNDPYRCNMCPHSSTDKSALLRHMRTHNGDRPYECSICRYAFTTKANCERHLRNRHAKMTREDVKKSIIYHPSEDPTNDFPDQSSYYSKEEFKKSLFSDSLKDSIGLLKNRISVSSLISEKAKVPRTVEPPESLKSTGSIINCSMNSSDWFDESSEKKSLNVSVITSDEEQDIEEVVEIEKGDTLVEPKVSEETPLDLSVDVLDLSKKSHITVISIKKDEDIPQDLSIKTNDLTQNMESSHSPSFPPPNNAAVKEEPTDTNTIEDSPVDMSGHVKNQINQLYDLVENRPFPPNLPAAFHPYFFPTPMIPLGFQPNINGSKDPFQKDIFRGMPMNPRGMMDQIAMASAAERIHAIQQQALAEYNNRMKSSKLHFDKKPVDSVSPVPNNNNNTINNINADNLSIKNPSHTSSSVKMVLKDGVLQAKPKQRRYRTERPFFCEHCSGRFTLRSNMERHIKQQHPQFWIQKQRGGSTGSRRGHPYKLLSFSEKDSKMIPMAPGFRPSGANGFEENNHHGKPLLKFGQNEGLKAISDEVRIAISLQLKNKVISNDENKYYEIMKSSDSSPENFRRLEELKDEEMSHMDRDGNEDTGNEDYDEDDEEEEDEELIIDETSVDNDHHSMREDVDGEKMNEENETTQSTKQKDENGALDLASVSRLLDNASTQTFRQFFNYEEENNHDRHDGSEEDEEGLVAGSNSEGSDENRSESEQNPNSSTEPNSSEPKKKSAYSLAPNRVFCPYCDRKFPWSSSLRRHILTHTGQKPYKCSHCPLLFTTKSNCDRHLLRKHGGQVPLSVEITDKTLLDAQAFAMRNVPERPYKCIYCPSSTFASHDNLKKHLISKHSEEKKSDDANSGYEESQGSGSEDIEVTDKKSPGMDYHMSGDLPFKCYLCEGSYAERQEALDHIRLSHAAEFQLLMSKGALDTNVNVSQEEPPHPHHDDVINMSEENLEQLKGKFPDYANRKVMCAFCLRRFWSAEDLRRHMRTHTGERPFSCDICRRKFTLKHSMLRHRKKHNKLSNSEDNFISDDEAPMPPHPFFNNNNSIFNIPVNFWVNREQEGTDLISNLLGIHDKSIIDKMLLTKSADDAARLLGVQK